MYYVCINKHHGTHVIVDLPETGKPGEFYLDPIKFDRIAARLCTERTCLHCGRGAYINKLYFTPRSGGRERFFVSESPLHYIDILPLSEVVLVNKAKLEWLKLVADRCEYVDDIRNETDLRNLRSNLVILMTGIMELSDGASSEREAKGKIGIIRR